MIFPLHRHQIRYRVYYAFVVGALIVLGISSRKLSDELPLLVAENSGDMLWAAMVYFGFRFLAVRKSLQWSLFASVAFSYFIEFSQLYQSGWVNEIRRTTLGALVLGHGFLAVDLLRYALGIVMAFAADTAVLGHLKSLSGHQVAKETSVEP